MIPIKIKTQPNDSTCGPTSLHAVYNFFGDKIKLKEVISQVSYINTGGTLAVLLGLHALQRGYTAKVYTYNLRIFDPSWFNHSATDLQTKLYEQLKHKKGKKFEESTKAYIRFLKFGGKILQADLTSSVLKHYFNKGLPVIAGLSATYLYNSKREFQERNDKSVYDDIKGIPVGHFVVLCGYDKEKKHVVVADPYSENPFSGDNYYTVDVKRLLNSILLGIVTYDANLLIIEPKKKEI